VYVLPVGISEIETSKVTLYPNPFHQSSILVFENSSTDRFRLTITDITGKVVASDISTDGNTIVIEKNHLREGLYFYHLLNTRTHHVHSGKMVIQ
jgi:hypothetical protein